MNEPVLEVAGHRRDLPVAGAQLRRGAQELRQGAVIEQRLSPHACIEQLEAASIEAAMETREQLQRERCKHLVRALDALTADLDLRPGLLAGVQLSVPVGAHVSPAYPHPGQI